MPFPGSQPTAPGNAAPPPPPAPNKPDLWVSVNGQTQQMSAAQYAQLPGDTQAMSLDQSSGWQPLSTFLGTTATHGTPAAPAGGGGGWARGGATGGGQQRGGRSAVFNGVGGAQITRRLPFISEGDYIFCVHKMFYNEGRTSNAVIAEGEIILSNDYGETRALPEGTSASIYIGKNDAFDRNVKELIIALSGFDDAGNPRPDDDYVSPEECEHWVSDANPAQGIWIYVSARNRQMKSSEKLFTAMSYYPVAKLPDGSIDWAKTGP